MPTASFTAPSLPDWRRASRADSSRLCQAGGRRRLAVADSRLATPAKASRQNSLHPAPRSNERGDTHTQTQMHTSAANTHSLLALKREIITREWHKSERPALAAAAPPSTPIVGRRAQALYEPAKQAAVNGLSSSVWRPPSNPERKRGVGRKLPANVP